jgi:hypothetical protein
VAAPCSQWIACSPVRDGSRAGRSTRSLDCSMNFAMFISVGLGYIGGVVAVFLLGRRIVARALRDGPFESAQRKTVVRWAAGGGFVALLPALLLGTVVGGTFGGAYGEIFSSSFGAGDAGVVPGIALGMFAVVAIILCAAVAIGAYAGRFLARREDAAI